MKRTTVSVVFGLVLGAGSLVLARGYLFVWAPVGLVLAGFINRRAVRRLLGKRFWIPMILLVVIMPFLGGGGEVRIFGIEYSLWRLEQAIAMCLRAMSLCAALGLITWTVSPAQLMRSLARVGLVQSGVVVTMAINCLPIIVEQTTRSWAAFRLRGGMRRRWTRNLYLLARTIILNTIHTGQQIGEALEANGIDLTGHHEQS